MTSTATTTAEVAPRKPTDQEIDMFGLTHPGRVRSSNQDHFLVCSLRKQIVIHQTSLPDVSTITGPSERAAFVAMVADGAGAGNAGEHASRLAVEAVTHYVTESMQCYYTANAEDETFAQALHEAAMRCHEGLLARAKSDRDLHGMATTLTLWIGVWPRGFLLQIGDSRAYRLRDGELLQVSRDQTMAQELVDLGALPNVAAASPRLQHTLSSAIGGPQTEPRVTRLDDSKWGDVGMICSDGLVRHVPNERIAERLRTMRSARQACEDLLQDALDAGGSDNITLFIARTLSPAPLGRDDGAR